MTAKRTAGIGGALLPNRPITSGVSLVIMAFWIGFALLAWMISPFESLPGPGEVFGALGSLWGEHGMSYELGATIKLILHGLLLTIVISLLLSYATVIAAMRPVVAAVSKLRFLGLTGLVIPFTLWTGGGYDLKVWLLTFGMTTYFVTSMAQVVIEIPREQFDHMRALGAGEVRTLWEVVVLGTADKALDVMRQNVAIGWTLITMVEGISRSEGGLGAMILNQNKHFRLAEVYAILIVILVVGLLLDYAIALLSRTVCPYAELERVKR
ncbi:MAG TPA: ABC transporter permease subunit [Haliangium sp.]|nr:ABC transporter permease subunit [Haliangium sp.]